MINFGLASSDTLKINAGLVIKTPMSFIIFKDISFLNMSGVGCRRT